MSRRRLFSIRLHFVRKERIGIDEVSADRSLTMRCVRTDEEVITNSARSVQQRSRPVVASTAKQAICPRAETWIASRSLSSGAHSRDPLAHNDEEA
jgi:hypothetical protein